MKTAVALLALLVAGAFFVVLLWGLGRRHPDGRVRWLYFPGGTLMVVGASGFFGNLLAGVGLIQGRFEWPVWYASNVVRLPENLHAVPLTPSGRLQLYDLDWKFVRAWPVDAGGGMFVVRPGGEGRVEVLTARGRRRYVYDLDGWLLESGQHAFELSSLVPESTSHFLSTRWWLWPFTHPFAGWAVLAAGMGLVALGARAKGNRRRPPKHAKQRA